MLKIGLTGGIGSGKSTVAKVFEILGIPVYKADDEAKRLMSTDPELITKIKEHFSDEAYINGNLNKSFLSSQVFNNKDKINLLNSIVHPFTINAGKRWMSQQKSPYAIKEAALIFESGSQGDFDLIIGVFAPLSLRIHRAMQRDHAEKEKIQERMQNQIKEEIKMKLCDEVLINNEQILLLPQIIALHEKILGKVNMH